MLVLERSGDRQSVHARRRVRRLALSRIASWYILGGVFLCCCSETPIDALISDSPDDFNGPGGESSAPGTGGGGAIAGSGSGGAGGTAGDASGAGGGPECPARPPFSGKLSIRSATTKLCLHAGPETMLMAPVPQQTAYRLEFRDTCYGSEWDFSADPLFPGAYIIQSREISAARVVIDIEFGNSEDGTRAILYVPAPSTGPILHQRFYFHERAPATFSVQPGHAVTKCLTDTTDTDGGMQIWSCMETKNSQIWELLPEQCLGGG